MPTIWAVQVLWQTMANVLVFARHVGTKFSMNAENDNKNIGTFANKNHELFAKKT